MYINCNTMNTSDVTMEDVQLDVSNVILDVIKKYVNSKNVRLNLTAKTLDIIHRVLNQFPELFQSIDEHIQVIIEDGVFDINDVPQIILMIKDIVNADKKTLATLKVTRSEAILFIEGILLILIDTNSIYHSF